MARDVVNAAADLVDGEATVLYWALDLEVVSQGNAWQRD
jgi:hypothetical protein